VEHESHDLATRRSSHGRIGLQTRRHIGLGGGGRSGAAAAAGGGCRARGGAGSGARWFTVDSGDDKAMSRLGFVGCRGAAPVTFFVV
jgi:hypothetical protein